MIAKLLTEHHLEFLILKGGCQERMSKCHIVGNHMPRLNYDNRVAPDPSGP